MEHSPLQMVPVAFSLCGTDVAVSGGGQLRGAGDAAGHGNTVQRLWGQAPRGSSCTASPRAPSQLGTRPRAPADGVAGRKCLMKRSGVICLG